MENFTTAIFDNPRGRKIAASIGVNAAQTLILREPTIINSEIPKNLLADLSEFDWIILGDPIAASQFVEKLSAANFDLFSLDAIRICAGGESAADRLRLDQLHTDIMPTKNLSGSIFETLIEYFGGEAAMRGIKFLNPQSGKELFGLAEKIIAAGGKVDSIPFFETVFDAPDLTRHKTLLKGGAIDEFIFTAPVEIYFLRRLLQTENIAEIFNGVKVSATDETTRQALRECAVNGYLLGGR